MQILLLLQCLVASLGNEAVICCGLKALGFRLQMLFSFSCLWKAGTEHFWSESLSPVPVVFQSVGMRWPLWDDAQRKTGTGAGAQIQEKMPEKTSPGLVGGKAGGCVSLACASLLQDPAWFVPELQPQRPAEGLPVLPCAWIPLTPRDRDFSLLGSSVQCY